MTFVWWSRLCDLALPSQKSLLVFCFFFMKSFSYTFFLIYNIFYKHIRLRFSKRISTLLSTLWGWDLPIIKKKWRHLVWKKYFHPIFRQSLYFMLFHNKIFNISTFQKKIILDCLKSSTCSCRFGMIRPIEKSTNWHQLAPIGTIALQVENKLTSHFFLLYNLKPC